MICEFCPFQVEVWCRRVYSQCVSHRGMVLCCDTEQGDNPTQVVSHVTSKSSFFFFFKFLFCSCFAVTPTSFLSSELISDYSFTAAGALK